MISGKTFGVSVAAVALGGLLILPAVSWAQDREGRERGERVQQRERGERGGRGERGERGGGGAALNRYSGALSDLNLTQEQEARVQQILSAAREEIQNVIQNVADPQERREQIQQIMSETRDEISQSLTEEQQAALQEALPGAFGPGGPGAAQLDPEALLNQLESNVAQLDLTTQQTERIDQIFTTTREQIEQLKLEGGETEADAPQDLRPLVRQAQQQVMQALTGPQRQQLQQLQRPARVRGEGEGRGFRGGRGERGDGEGRGFRGGRGERGEGDGERPRGRRGDRRQDRD